MRIVPARGPKNPLTVAVAFPPSPTLLLCYLWTASLPWAEFCAYLSRSLRRFSGLHLSCTRRRLLLLGTSIHHVRRSHPSYNIFSSHLDRIRHLTIEDIYNELHTQLNWTALINSAPWKSA
ncbi:hypothetical protein BDZ89DRAFT_92215 [Hymenopellis radicata]|nr:hypothetical protein BDZ89DRAFT_92215 [Hymenopellis radicata]